MPCIASVRPSSPRRSASDADRVGELAGAAQRLGARARQLPAREARLLGRGVHGDHPHRLGGGSLVAVHPDDDVDDGVHHPRRAPVDLELAEEERLDPGAQLLGAPGLVEERDGHLARLVRDVDLHERAALLRAARAHGPHLGEHDRLVADREVREVRLARAVEVPAREREEQVEDRADAEGLERLGSLRPDARETVDRDLVELGEPAAVAHSTPKRYG